MLNTPARPAFTVGVYRLDCNNVVSGGPGTPGAWASHRLRGQALHELFGQDAAWQVTDWGQTDDATSTHEYVEMALDLMAHPHLSAAAAAALTFVGAAVGGAATDLVKDGIKYLIQQIWEKNQAQQKFQEVIITAENGVQVRCFIRGGRMEIIAQQAANEQQGSYPPVAVPGSSEGG